METQGQSGLNDLRKDEYKSLRTAIDDATKAQLQIFTFSVVTSSTLLGVFIKFGGSSYTAVTINVFLVPSLILIPCAYLIRNLRGDIYRTATYIQVFIEEDNPVLYEGALGLIRDRFRSKESFNPIFVTYWMFWIICVSFFAMATIDAKLNLSLLHAVPWVLSASFLIHAHKQFGTIPNTHLSVSTRSRVWDG